MNTLNSVNKLNKTPARAINFVGNKNKTEDRKTVEVAEALPALLLLLPLSLLLLLSFSYQQTHTYMHTNERQRRQRVWHRQRQPSEANPTKLCMQLQVGVAVAVCVCSCVCTCDQNTHTHTHSGTHYKCRVEHPGVYVMCLSSKSANARALWRLKTKKRRRKDNNTNKLLASPVCASIIMCVAQLRWQARRKLVAIKTHFQSELQQNPLSLCKVTLLSDSVKFIYITYIDHIVYVESRECVYII